jgi:endo-1,4-beta-xylanase
MRLCFMCIILMFLHNYSFSGSRQVQAKQDIQEKAKVNIEKFRKAEFTFMLEGGAEGAKVDVEQISHEFLFGCIIFDLVNHGRASENEELFKQRFKKLFNFAVFPFYWASYEPRQGQTNEAKIREVAAWCIENGMTAKGHPLAWTHTAGTPQWLARYNDEETRQLLQLRIEDIVSGFKDQIQIWDVFNEVIHTVNWEVALRENRAKQDNRYVGKDFMSEKIGFIDSCFRWAYDANPDAHLVLNEFDVVYNELSRKRFYEVLKALQQLNTPVSGIGIQAHEPFQGRVYYSPQQIWETFEMYAGFNLPLHITELIPVSNGDSIKGGYKTGIWTEAAQAEFAEMIFTLAFGHPLVESINWWGFSDANIWQPGGGLVDEELNPKMVYNTLDKLINQEWKTRISELQPDSKGRISFRGFKGDYMVTIRQNGEVTNSYKITFEELTSGKAIVPLKL